MIKNVELFIDGLTEVYHGLDDPEAIVPLLSFFEIENDVDLQLGQDGDPDTPFGSNLSEDEFLRIIERIRTEEGHQDEHYLDRFS